MDKLLTKYKLKMVRRLTLASLMFITVFSLNASSSLGIVKLKGTEFKYYQAQGKESLYAISKKYSIPLDSLQKWNPEITGELKKGMKVFWPAMESRAPEKTDTLKPGYVNYDVKWGDTFSKIANNFCTTIEDLFKDNPSLTPQTLYAGDKIRVNCGSANKLISIKENIDTVITFFNAAIVKNGDSWEGMARANNVSVGLLRETNPEISQPKKNNIVSIPVLNVIKKSISSIVRDSREMTDAGVIEIYQEVADSRKPHKKIITVVLSAPSGNKDIDFSRGFLLALSKMHDLKEKVDLRFVNGTPDSFENNNDINEADVIVATYEKDFPAALAQNAAQKEVINVFDLKDDSYLHLKGMNNLLQSPETFNSDATNAILNRFEDAQYVFLGDPLKANDALANELMARIPMDHFEVVSTLDDVVAPYSGDFIIYSFATKKEDIGNALKQIEKFMADNPQHANISVIGRPNWIMYTSAFDELMHKTSTYFPSRFYINEDAPEFKAFQTEYKEMWGKQPIKSYPLYAAMGYDTAEWLLSNNSPLQISFNLKQEGNAGKVNHTCFFVHFLNDGEVEVIK